MNEHGENSKMFKKVMNIMMLNLDKDQEYEQMGVKMKE